MGSQAARAHHGPVTLLVWCDRGGPSGSAHAWVFDTEEEAVQAARTHSGEPWYILYGGWRNPRQAMDALRCGGLLLRHSVREAAHAPRTGPSLHKCGTPCACSPHEKQRSGASGLR